MVEPDYGDCLAAFDELRHRLSLYCESVAGFFSTHPTLMGENGPVHSVKSRLKDPEHLRGKLARKAAEGRVITRATLFSEVTDLAGVRVFHLDQSQFPQIHHAIYGQVDAHDWVLAEKPKAFSWDPESREFFQALGFEPEIRPTFYTSIHYLVRPSQESPLCCEIQVRTLFEEIWGEIDHRLNYPAPTESIACREQLRALSKLVGTGGRLVDALLRSQAEFSARFK